MRYLLKSYTYRLKWRERKNAKSYANKRSQNVYARIREARNERDLRVASTTAKFSNSIKYFTFVDNASLSVPVALPDIFMFRCTMYRLSNAEGSLPSSTSFVILEYYRVVENIVQNKTFYICPWSKVRSNDIQLRTYSSLPRRQSVRFIFRMCVEMHPNTFSTASNDPPRLVSRKEIPQENSAP